MTSAWESSASVLARAVTARARAGAWCESGSRDVLALRKEVVRRALANSGQERSCMCRAAILGEYYGALTCDVLHQVDLPSVCFIA
eukprot:5369309-Pleurochrysis_carterae.AAC.1